VRSRAHSKGCAGAGLRSLVSSFGPGPVSSFSPSATEKHAFGATDVRSDAGSASALPCRSMRLTHQDDPGEAVDVGQDLGREARGEHSADSQHKNAPLSRSRNEGHALHWNASQDARSAPGSQHLSCQVVSCRDCSNVGCPRTDKTTARRPSCQVGVAVVRIEGAIGAGHHGGCHGWLPTVSAYQYTLSPDTKKGPSLPGAGTRGFQVSANATDTKGRGLTKSSERRDLPYPLILSCCPWQPSCLPVGWLYVCLGWGEWLDKRRTPCVPRPVPRRAVACQAPDTYARRR
jgi:hypothetical protein